MKLLWVLPSLSPAIHPQPLPLYPFFFCHLHHSDYTIATITDPCLCVGVMLPSSDHNPQVWSLLTWEPWAGGPAFNTPAELVQLIWSGHQQLWDSCSLCSSLWNVPRFLGHNPFMNLPGSLVQWGSESDLVSQILAQRKHLEQVLGTKWKQLQVHFIFLQEAHDLSFPPRNFILVGSFPVCQSHYG